MLRLICEHIHSRFFLKQIMIPTEKTPEKDTKGLLEPEDHIAQYGVDDYLNYYFSSETPAQKLRRRNHLMSFRCLKAKQDAFLNGKVGDRPKTTIENRYHTT